MTAFGDILPFYPCVALLTHPRDLELYGLAKANGTITIYESKPRAILVAAISAQDADGEEGEGGGEAFA